MWRAALPCRHAGLVLAGSIVAAALAAAVSSGSRRQPLRRTRLWAIALPDAVEDGLAAHSSVARGPRRRRPSSPSTLQTVPFETRSGDEVRPKLSRRTEARSPKKRASRRVRSALRGVVTTPVGGRAARASPLVDYVVIAVKTPCSSGCSAAATPSVAGSSRSSRSGNGWLHSPGAPVLGMPPPTRLSTWLLPQLLAAPHCSAATCSRPPPVPYGIGSRADRAAQLAHGRRPLHVDHLASLGCSCRHGRRLRPLRRRCLRPGRQRAGDQDDRAPCGRTYSFAVDAYATDAASRSDRVAVSTSTDPCSGGGGAGGGGNAASDGVAPSTPLGFAKTSSTQTTIVVSWAPSTVNVAVGGYGLYRGGALVGSSIVPAYSFSGLSCGTTYSLAVDAYDAAWQSLRSNDDFGGDERMRGRRGHDPADGTRLALPHNRNHDLDHGVVGGVDGQHRRLRIRPLPEQRVGGV